MRLSKHNISYMRIWYIALYDTSTNQGEVSDERLRSARCFSGSDLRLPTWTSFSPGDCRTLERWRWQPVWRTHETLPQAENEDVEV
jgi:hypothetical protein